MKIVLDTSVLISALIKKGGPRFLAFELLRGKVQLILSREILNEFTKVVRDPKIRRYVNEEDIIKFLEAIISIAKIVKVSQGLKLLKKILAMI